MLRSDEHDHVIYAYARLGLRLTFSGLIDGVPDLELVGILLGQFVQLGAEQNVLFTL